MTDEHDESSAEVASPGSTVSTDVPPRLDRLHWSPWHTTLVLALGVTWILDGLEASLIANLGPILQDRETLHLSGIQVGEANTLYLLGQVLGALFFGRLTDSLGRKKLFLTTLAVYLTATALSGLAPNFYVFGAFRFLAGTGIGGEYSAINSAIDELIPARVRGQVDLGINGSYWIGVAAGAALTEVLLNPAYLPRALGWRLAFGLGAVLGLIILFVRRHIPESPRWLLMHGRLAESERVVAGIEATVVSQSSQPLSKVAPVRVRITGSVGALYIARILLKKHGRRTLLGLSLMIGQTFLYNAIFFSSALILHKFYGVPENGVGRYLIPFAAGNFLGPLLLGRLFDRLGRRVMISATYVLSGVLLIATGYAFCHGLLDATTQTLCWCIVFFFASAAASSAYLTVSELLPVEIRGMAIALFYAVATGFGALAPTLFGALVQSQSRPALLKGYLLGASLMIGAGLIAARIGVAAEGRSLEQLGDEPGSAAELSR